MSDSSHDDRTRVLLDRVRSLMDEGSEDALERASASDQDLLDELEDLLAAHAPAQAGAPPDAAPTPRSLSDLEPGTRLGPYRLLDQLGEGGFGTVYLAEQREPIRRRVALKVIKLGMDTRQVIARFEAERQALALMTHSNIARVLDVGATDTGRPYFVMELVSGVPITDYCEKARLDVDARLGLFVQVCHALQHAHQKGVIHRDIKPSNILVAEESGHAIPKVIDFGIAKATLTSLTDKTLVTQQQQIIGTPAYMPPEQAEQSGLDVDTRSDLYALGVLLYELLTGATPFDSKTLNAVGRTEMLRIIREVEPPRPSVRVAGRDDERDAHRRPPDPDLARRLSGDLDWIVMKCLEKDRTKRYGTASELAAEVQRHLDHEPVLAGAPSTAYRLRKLVRRHRAAVLGGSVATALVIVAIAGTTWGWLETEAARAESQQRADELERVAGLQEAQLRSLDGVVLGLELRDLLFDQAADVSARRELSAEAAAQSVTDLEAQLQGVSFRDLALDILITGVLDPTLQAVRDEFGDQPLARARLEDALAAVLLRINRPEQAEPLQRAAYQTRRDLLGAEAVETLESLHQLALVVRDGGDLKGALEHALACHAACVRALGPEDRTTLSVAATVALALQDVGRLDEAIEHEERVLEARLRLFGEHDPDTLDSLDSLGEALFYAMEWERGGDCFRRALDGRRVAPDSDPMALLNSMNNYAQALRSHEDRGPALALATEFHRETHALLGERHPVSRAAARNLGSLLRDMGDFVGAEPLLEQALQLEQSVGGDVAYRSLDCYLQLGLLRAWQGRGEEADELLEQAWLGGMRRLGERHYGSLEYGFQLSDLRLRAQQPMEAEPPVVELAHLALRVLADNDKRLPWYRENVDRLVSQLEQRLSTLSGPSDETLACINALAGALNVAEREEESEELLAVALTQHEPSGLDVSIGLLAECRSLMGEAMAIQGRWGEAEPLLLEGFGGLEAHPHASVEPTRLSRAARRLVRYFEGREQPEAAAVWEGRVLELEGRTE
jgi:non-specific serine/threonine protein kinase/serine/threonine-protein kinase